MTADQLYLQLVGGTLTPEGSADAPTLVVNGSQLAQSPTVRIDTGLNVEDEIGLALKRPPQAFPMLQLQGKHRGQQQAWASAWERE